MSLPTTPAPAAPVSAPAPSAPASPSAPITAPSGPSRSAPVIGGRARGANTTPLREVRGAELPEENVSLDDDDLGDVSSTPPPKAEFTFAKTPKKEESESAETPPAPKKKEDSLEPVLDEDNNLIEPEEEVAEKPSVAPATEKRKRDYSQFTDPEMENIARALPNELFAKFSELAPKWKEAVEENKTLREIANKVPSFHYEHPEGYVLSSEWPQVTQAFNALSHETSHWEQQLLAIKQGEPWQDFLGYDNKGQAVYKTVAAPENGQIDYRAELHVSKAMNSASARLQQTQASAQNLITGYGQRVSSAKEEMRQLEKKLFPTMDKAKFAGEDKESFDLAGQLIPPEFAKHPVADIAKLTYVLLQRVARKGRTWKTELDRANAQLAGRARSQNTRIPTEGEASETADDMIPLED